MKVGQTIWRRMRHDESKQARPATVIYVHPEGRFATLEWRWTVKGSCGETIVRTVREAVEPW